MVSALWVGGVGLFCAVMVDGYCCSLVGLLSFLFCLLWFVNLLVAVGLVIH